MQNTAVCIIFRLSKFCHITPMVFSLHWLPVKNGVDFKICLCTFKSLHGLAPSYISNLLTARVNSYNFRSSNQQLLNLPRNLQEDATRPSIFTVAAPKLWNSLPVRLGNLDCLNKFKCHLKAHLLKQALSS